MSVRRRIETCRACGLYRGCKRPVPYRGPTPADVAVIGEAPGSAEDARGKPFVGPAGQLLEGLAQDAGVNTSQWFWCNIVSCRPEGNRDPFPAEIRACALNLKLQLALARPRVIILAGRFALNHYRPDAKITRAHGRPFKIGAVYYFPIFHPAYALRTDEAKDDLRLDLAVFNASFILGDDPWEGWPETCEKCGAAVDQYDAMGVAWCKRHYPKMQMEGQRQMMIAT